MTVTRCSAAQSRALAHVTARAEAAAPRARARIEDVVARGHVGSLDVDEVAKRICEHARHANVTLSFHPDRVRKDGCSVAEGLLRDGRYRNQFETQVTNGSRTAFAGGDRDRWEQQLFGGAYHAADTRDDERPKYGGLNVMRHADGASPRFGSCYLVLRPEVTERCTLTWGDSHEGPADVGTIDRF
jgi:hypothetical protein